MKSRALRVCLSYSLFFVIGRKNLLVPLHAHMNKRRLQEPIGARDTPPTPHAKVVHFSYSQPLSRLCHPKLSDLLRKHCKELSNLCSVESVWSVPPPWRALHLVPAVVILLMPPSARDDRSVYLC